MGKSKKSKKDSKNAIGKKADLKKSGLKKRAKTKKAGSEKKAKPKKGARHVSAAPSIEEMLRGLTCPCCSKRCSLAKPKCGKGRALARKKAERAA